MIKNTNQKMEFIYITNSTLHHSIKREMRESISYERKIGRF